MSIIDKAAYDVYDFIEGNCQGRWESVLMTEWYGDSIICKIRTLDRFIIANNALALLPDVQSTRRIENILKEYREAIAFPIQYHQARKNFLYVGLLGLGITVIDWKLGLSVLVISIVAFAVIKQTKRHFHKKATKILESASSNSYIFLGKGLTYEQLSPQDKLRLPAYTSLDAFKISLGIYFIKQKAE